MSDVLLSNRTKKIKNQFFMQIDLLIDWKPINNIINRCYIKKHDATGRPAFDGLMVFKICLLQSWYGLSDYEAEDRINDSLSFSSFMGFLQKDVLLITVLFAGLEIFWLKKMFLTNF